MNRDERFNTFMIDTMYEINPFTNDFKVIL